MSDNMVPCSKEDKILIKSVYECKGYSAWQFIAEFPDKGWTNVTFGDAI